PLSIPNVRVIHLRDKNHHTIENEKLPGVDFLLIRKSEAFALPGNNIGDARIEQGLKRWKVFARFSFRHAIRSGRTRAGMTKRKYVFARGAQKLIIKTQYFIECFWVGWDG